MAKTASIAKLRSGGGVEKGNKGTRRSLSSYRTNKKSDKSKNSKIDGLRPVATDEILKKVLKKPATRAGERYLAALGPKVHEETKTLLLLKGHHTSEKCTRLLSDFNIMRSPYSLYLNKRNQTRLMEPMDKPEDFVYLNNKNGTSLFAMTSSTKKRPLRLFCGRLFEENLLDRLEFDVLEYEPLKLNAANSPRKGSKPLVLFQGSAWDLTNDLLAAKNVLADILGGIKADKVLLEGFDHVYVATAYEELDPVTDARQCKIKLDHFHIAMKRAQPSSDTSSVTSAQTSAIPDAHPSNQKQVRAELTDIGPSLVLKLARAISDPDMMKRALRVPSETFKKGKGKTTTDDLLQTSAQVHLRPQSLKELNLRHGH